MYVLNKRELTKLTPSLSTNHLEVGVGCGLEGTLTTPSN